MLTVVNVTAADNKKRPEISPACNPIADTWSILFIISIRIIPDYSGSISLLHVYKGQPRCREEIMNPSQTNWEYPASRETL